MRYFSLLSSLPMSLLPLIMIGGATLVIFGVVRPGQLLLFVFVLALLPVFAGLLGGLLDVLPWWVSVLVMVFAVVSMVRAVSSLLLGDRASDHMVGALAASAVTSTLRAVVMLPVYLIRGISWVVRR